MAAPSIVDKVRRLLRLAEDERTNITEAQNALAAAQKLMLKHRLKDADLHEPVDPDSIKVWRDHPLEEGAAIPDWRQAVGAAVAQANDCMAIIIEQNRGGQRRQCLVIAGRDVDAEVTREMYSWIVERVEAVAQHERLARASARRRIGLGHRWLRSFRNGAAASIEERLARDELTVRAALPGEQCQALDVRRNAVALWMQEHAHVVDAEQESADNDAEGWRAGRVAGNELPLRKDE